MTRSADTNALLAAALPEVLAWTDRPTGETLAPLPKRPAVLLLIADDGVPVQLLTTQALQRVVTARLLPPDDENARRGKADLGAVVRGVRWRQVECPFEARWWYWQLARHLYPTEYRDLVGFGPAWFLNVDWSQPIPEVRVTERIWRHTGAFIGPWPARSQCQEALEGLWDLFDLCRHPEQVRRAPQGERCAYAEMGRCDAPCDGSAELQPYRTRCQAAWAFAAGAQDEWLTQAQIRMRAAAAAQQFEEAGRIKRQREFAQRWQRQWSSHARPADDWVGLLVLPVARRKASKLFLFRRGELLDGPVLPNRKLAAAGTDWAVATMSQPPVELDPDVRMEQTWLCAHLFGRTATEHPLFIDLHADVAADTLRTQLAAHAAVPPPPPPTDDVQP